MELRNCTRDEGRPTGLRVPTSSQVLGNNFQGADLIPDALDVLFCDAEGYPGMHSPAVRDWIANNQITADAWYVANPNLTVAETRRLERLARPSMNSSTRLDSRSG
jgi:hypothetical protein